MILATRLRLRTPVFALSMTAAAGVSVPSASAQRLTFARVQETDILGELQECPIRNARSSPPAAMSGSREGQQVTFAPLPDTVYHRDSVFVHPRMDARLLLADHNNSQIVLAPSILCTKRIIKRNDRPIMGVAAAQQDAAHYQVYHDEIVRGTLRRTVPAIAIRSGGLVIRWQDKLTPLLVVPPKGRRLEVRGTELAVAVDSLGNLVVFVASGTVYLENDPVPLQANRALLVNESAVQPVASDGFKDAVKFHGTTVWANYIPQPVIRWPPSPAMLGGIVGVLGITALIITNVGDDGPDIHDGTVTVVRPFRR